MNENIIKLIAINIFPWGLSIKCPCPCREPQPTSASPRGSPLTLGWSLDLLWDLWGPLRCWSGPIPVCACPQHPQLPELDRFHLWEHSLSTQIFHRCRVYLADCGDLICSLYRWWKDYWSSSLVTLSLGFSFGFYPHLRKWSTHRSLVLRLPWSSWVCPSDDRAQKWYDCLDSSIPGGAKCAGKPEATGARDIGNFPHFKT